MPLNVVDGVPVVVPVVGVNPVDGVVVEGVVDGVVVVGVPVVGVPVVGVPVVGVPVVGVPVVGVPVWLGLEGNTQVEVWVAGAVVDCWAAPENSQLPWTWPFLWK